VRLVLLPGLDGTGVLFRPFVRELPAGIDATVIALPAREPLDYPELIRYVTPLLPPSGPFVLLGESFSGPLALFLAASGLPGLRGVILAASFVRNPTFVPAWLRFLAGAWLFRFTPAFIQAKALLGGYSTPELRPLLAEAHGAVSPDVMAQRVRSILTVDAAPALRAVRVPLGYIQGTHDHVVPASNLGEIRAARPDVAVYRVGAPHLVLQVQPEAAAAATASFIASVDGGRDRRPPG
jgi:pimeloyl-ACP methyl ester carboxylesterase